MRVMRQKLGLVELVDDDADRALISDLLQVGESHPELVEEQRLSGVPLCLSGRMRVATTADLPAYELCAE